MFFALHLLVQTAGATAAAAVPAVTQCNVFDAAPKSVTAGGAGMLIGACGDQGAPLGPATQFSTTRNIVSGTVLVVRKQDGRTQVLLVAPTQGGVSVDDVTRDLTKLTGRFGDLGLGSDEVDTTRFAVDGSVGVATAQGRRWLDLAAYVRFAAKIVTAALPVTQAPSGASAR